MLITHNISGGGADLRMGRGLPVPGLPHRTAPAEDKLK